MQGGYKTYKKVIHKELSYQIVGILFDVYNELGYGYQERYYEEKTIESFFIARKMKYQRQMLFEIRSRGEIIGTYYLDFLVEDKIILEIKKGDYFSRQNIEQVKGYLQATGLELAILANFTPHGVRFLRVLNAQKVKV